MISLCSKSSFICLERRQTRDKAPTDNKGRKYRSEIVAALIPLQLALGKKLSELDRPAGIGAASIPRRGAAAAVLRPSGQVAGRTFTARMPTYATEITCRTARRRLRRAASKRPRRGRRIGAPHMNTHAINPRNSE